MEFKDLRTKYNTFHYKSYSATCEAGLIRLIYDFSIDGLSDFRTTWEISRVFTASYDKKKLDLLAFCLGLVESLSVWKLTCAKDFIIDCFFLDKKQEDWFRKLLIYGLGEFFYKNGINVEDIKDSLVDFKENGNVHFEKEISNDIKSINSDKVLIPIGGGKDSAVTLELLKEMDRYAFIVNPRKATLDTFEKSKISKEKLLVAKRTFDKNIIKYNEEGFLNGHTPFSALISFASVLTAYVNGIGYVALSNESSANESTVKGLKVNHQYSKTFEYESDFIDFEKENIGTGVKYFSFLRPLTEVAIAKIFSKLTDYHMIFRSCNVGSKEDIWCGACAKCLFVYIILSPFIERNDMIKIFGKDLLDDESLKDIFDKLIGKVPEKPFECVGSRDEINAALGHLMSTYGSESSMPKLLKYYKDLNIATPYDLSVYCSSFDHKNHLPEGFKKYIKIQ